ncbi:MAG: DUF2306 domain-containing protein [Rhodanobacteraceae bacterium]
MLLLPIHVTAGLVSIAAGAVALSAAKGSPLHRRSGDVFVVAMLTMASTGAFLAAVKSDRGTALGGLLVLYVTSTGALAVRRTIEQSRGWLTGLMLFGFAIAAVDYALGFAARTTPGGRIDGYPAFLYFAFGSVALLYALGDARALRVPSLDGTHRLVRHIGRMGFAMWMATTSFFLGQAKVFPEPLRHAVGMRAIPVALVAIVVIYWLMRTRFARRRPRPLPLRSAEIPQ